MEPDAVSPDVGADHPCVSVALATYNGAQYLPDLLDSLAAQSWRPLEIIASDDCSSDDTLQILQRYDSSLKIRILPHGPKQGIIGNFSRALDACTSPYITLADQDDIWLQKKIQLLMEKMHELEKAQGVVTPIMVFCDLEVVDKNLQRLANSFFGLTGKSKRCTRPADFFLTNHIPGCAMLLNRALLTRAMPIPPTVVMHDWWFALVASSFGAIECVDLPLVRYRQHVANTIGASVRRSQLRKLKKILSPAAWKRHLAGADSFSDRVVRNLSAFERRYGANGGNAAALDLKRLRSAIRNPVGRLLFYRYARTNLKLNEYWLLMSAMRRSAKQFGQAGSD